jgi:nitroreductase
VYRTFVRPPIAWGRMDLETALRSRRTHKAFDPSPVPRDVLDELFELARWAPNHHLTNPWRFRVLGADAVGALKAAAGPEQGAKLDRAPTLIAATAVQCGDDPAADEEDALAAACAIYALLLAAHARGLGGYWRTPAVLLTPEGRAACGIPDGERVLGLVHLGTAKGEKAPPERAPVDAFVTYLD